MKLSFVPVTVLILGVARLGQAQTATQTVTFQVDAINDLSVSGTPSLVINSSNSGSAPSSATSAGHTWAVTTNQTGAKVTASIGSDMPAGLTLSAVLSAPSGANSAGLKALSTTPVDVVTAISKLNASGLGLSYQLDATAAAGVVPSTTRVVTYTITGGV